MAGQRFLQRESSRDLCLCGLYTVQGLGFGVSSVTGLTQEFARLQQGFLKVGGISEVGLLKTCKYVGPTVFKKNVTQPYTAI